MILIHQRATYCMYVFSTFEIPCFVFCLLCRTGTGNSIGSFYVFSVVDGTVHAGDGLSSRPFALCLFFLIPPSPDVAYTSYLKRAIKTCWHALEQTGLVSKHIRRYSYAQGQAKLIPQSFCYRNL